MQTPATTTGLKEGCEICGKNKSPVEYSAVSARQRAGMWSFQWKATQRGACHGSQIKQHLAIASHMQKSCQSFCPVVTALYKAWDRGSPASWAPALSPNYQLSPIWSVHLGYISEPPRTAPRNCPLVDHVVVESVLVCCHFPGSAMDPTEIKTWQRRGLWPHAKSSSGY